MKNIPSPPTRHWFTGNTSSYLIRTPFEEMIEWARTVPNTGLIRYYIVGNKERILLTSPKALGELLVQKVYDFPKPEMVRLSLSRVTGKHGVLLVEGEKHKKQRKNLMPAFSYRHIKDLYPVFWSKSIEMVKLIESDLRRRADTEDNVIRVSEWASRATLDIIGVAGMDHDFGSLRNSQNELTKHYERLLSEPSVGMRIIFVVGILLANLQVIQSLPLKRNREFRESSQFIRDVARQVIREKESKMKDGQSAPGSGIDIVSVALESGAFTEEELVDQMMTFLAAGHETTSTALQWSIYALCKHRDVQTRLREEVRSNLPAISAENPEPLSAATLDSLPYLNAFCNEVFRFHPSVPGTMRETARDTSLVGYPIPQGTRILISPEVVNHSKELWGPDADQFNVERWLGPGRANTGGASSNYSFLTFLHGSRSCIGQGFAKAELACLVAATVGRFEMELKDPEAKLEVRLSATVAPKDGVVAKFTPLEGW
ncbi:cytochrome P450 [Aspergillus clavatus NRRL 1]|uniref:Cytochrome P450 monooxygenase, putative n=1 Tax=Aspergillus clavatus (strain ATCC 1007 / CBS 513.65 / DSM 816 / NCTC 3887 / NRRL 1 / QM 1276 / 107) TaxID=344612 RepID=A1CEN3_ASPCL|nr:cytochrome P450 monooxygenase, putative [Aspergillus clavatus NRRL 1]EAW11332.1 cytochrome P450 monooxygenase, putative [Aspergillus clavatus NRRL 1]